MALWCKVEDVYGELGPITGANFTPLDVEGEIAKAVTDIIMLLSGQVDADTHSAWDSAANNVPPAITSLCAKYTAVKILARFVPGQSIADPQSRAGSLYKLFSDAIKSINRNSLFLQTSPTNTDQLPTQKNKIESTVTEDDREFTRDTLRNF